MAEYQITTSNRNFQIRDPFARLTNDVAKINLQLDQTHPAGQPLFFHPELGSEWQYYQLLSFDQSYTGACQMLGLPPSTQQTVTASIPALEVKPFIFLSQPNKNQFADYCVGGRWNTHIFVSTSNQAEIQVVSALVKITNVNGIISSEFLSEAVDVNAINIAPSTLPSHYTLSQNTSAAKMDVAGSQVGVILYFLNKNGLTAADVTLYFGEEYPARVETTLTTINPLTSMTWQYCLNQTGPSSPVYNNTYTGVLPSPTMGSFYLYDQVSGDPSPGPIPMHRLYADGYARLNLTNFVGQNLFYTFNSFTDSFSNVNLQIVDAEDPSQYIFGTYSTFNQTPGSPNPETEYKGFNYMYFRTYGDDPSINRVFIFSMTGDNGANKVNQTYVYSNNDTAIDYHELYFNDVRPDVFCYSVVYGSTDWYPPSPKQLNDYFRAFVDNIIYNSSGAIDGVTGMQSRFTSNFSSLTGTLPALYENFEFLNLSQQPASGGSGIGFEVSLSCGRTYFYGDNGYNSGSGYQVGEVLTIDGALLGGVSGLNDATIIVTQIDEAGGVITFTVSGNAQYLQNQNYIQDGGSDQYDSGNYIYANGNNISYGSGLVQSDVLGAGSECIVEYNSSIFAVFGTNTSGMTNFYSDGETGEDGDGTDDIGNINIVWEIELQDANNFGNNGFFQAGRFYNFNITQNQTMIASLKTGLNESSKLNADKRTAIYAKKTERKLQVSQKLKDMKPSDKVKLALDRKSKRDIRKSRYVKFNSSKADIQSSIAGMRKALRVLNLSRK